MKYRKVSDDEKDLIFKGWQDRKPIKAIAAELGRCYGTIYTELKRRYLVG
jgi:IS30 family transposase